MPGQPSPDIAALIQATIVPPLTLRFQLGHDLVELIEVAVADVHGAAGLPVVDTDSQAQRVADPFFQRHRIRVFLLAAARASTSDRPCAAKSRANDSM